MPNPLIRVTVENPPNPPEQRAFTETFRVGRADDAAVCIRNDYVSRHHIEVAFENGAWTVRDLNSSNGIFVNGERVPSTIIATTGTVRLGTGGPFLAFEVEQPSPKSAVSPPIGNAAPDVERYFRKERPGEIVGEHTMLVRKAFSQVQKKQKSHWLILVGALAIVLIVASGIAVWEHRRASKQLALAESIFYSMKALDVDIANFERIAADTSNPAVASQIRKNQQLRREMEARYNEFVDSIKGKEKKLTPRQQLTLRVARIFGECDLNMPPEFQAEIDNYIGKWQSSGRFAHAIAVAKERGYNRAIAQELLAVDLPPQFFYLALQESNFDQYISGPETRLGIAKGMWQFIPQTAVKYGLKIGPLVELPRPDPSDDRHHWELETKAAAHYMKDLYSTDAQASGLLVMSCYNWGEDRVLPLVRSMPANPHDRNFWKLLTKYRDKVPRETYDYVFYITSAAIIGENPRLFGFDFDNPLAHLESR